MEKSKQTKTNTGGRPLSYDPTLVRKIIETGLFAGIPAALLDASFVKQKLCDDHGVKGSIRQESLESLVGAAHAEIADAENRALLKALPAGVVSTVDRAVAAIGRDLLLVVARQHAASQAVADLMCEELRADKRNAQHCMADLEGDLAESREALETLAREQDEMVAELVELRGALRMANAEVDRLRSVSSGVDRLLTELRDPAVRKNLRTALAEIAAAPEPAPEAQPS